MSPARYPPHTSCDDDASALRAYGFGDPQGLAGFAAKVDSMPEAWVYLLRCCDGSLYTGWTVDLERRLARHSAGTASRYTASRLPVELELAISMPDRTTARREEARIKRLPRATKLALLSRAHQAPERRPSVLLPPRQRQVVACSEAGYEDGTTYA